MGELLSRLLRPKRQKGFYSSKLSKKLQNGIALLHLVGQDILPSKYNVMSELNFWTPEKKDAEAEMDYIVLKNNYVIFIEIKSGSTLKGKTFYALNLPYYLASKLEEYIE